MIALYRTRVRTPRPGASDFLAGCPGWTVTGSSISSRKRSDPVPAETRLQLVNPPWVWSDRRIFRAVLVCTDSRKADAMRRLTFGMNLSLDGYIAAPGDDLGWSVPSDE